MANIKQINIEAIKHEASGDWHDKPLRYAVNGPDSEVQKFSTKKDALKYKSLRNSSETQSLAISRFSRI